MRLKFRDWVRRNVFLIISLIMSYFIDKTRKGEDNVGVAWKDKIHLNVPDKGDSRVDAHQ